MTEKLFHQYAPEGRFLWDSWFHVEKNNGSIVYRMYHLDAPLSEDPMERHDRAQIRSAVSKDLVNWKDEGIVFGPGEKGTWDDLAIWTGNVYKKNDKNFVFFYTGRNEREGDFQRIGLAHSSDGIKWSRKGAPLIEPDSRWYETTERAPVCRAWRDPAIFYDEETGIYHLVFTARTKTGDPKYRGCIGHAVSTEIDGEYEIKLPLLAPGRYAEMEVPDLIRKNGKFYLFFGVFEPDYEPGWAEEVGTMQRGLHCYVSDEIEGEYEPLKGHGIIAGTDTNLYSLKILPDPEEEGGYVAVGWHMENCGHQKAYTLSAPMKVKWEGDNIRIDIL